ncbi:hypothetical protein D9615_000722 [Tricholomella constricta]|uniref:CUE domain-containing protein n=1 Tax=Tricholomella constricta TaxID=117010 RepID=A0A8H5HQF8_9AGAR|nr:hypothetical protein D9615_000722 [Tricholomella constricta]
MAARSSRTPTVTYSDLLLQRPPALFMSFENASVTKGLMVGYGLTSILAGLFDVKHYFHLQVIGTALVPSPSGSVSQVVLLADVTKPEIDPPSTGGWFSTIWLSPIQIERQFGSIKFASFALVSTLMATILELLSLMLFNRVGLNHFAMGPSPLIFSMLYQYARIVPSTYNYRIFGIPLNSKSLIYLLAIQVQSLHFRCKPFSLTAELFGFMQAAISRPPGSVAVAIIGILVGQIYRSDLANLKAYRISPTLTRLATRFLLPLVGSLRPPRRSNRALPDESRASSTRNVSSLATPQNEEVITTARPSPGGATPRHRTSEPNFDAQGTTGTDSVMREWMNELTGRTEGASGGIRVPSEAEIAQLTTMFPDVQREVVIGALQRSPNIEAAVETLLSPQS